MRHLFRALVLLAVVLGPSSPAAADGSRADLASQPSAATDLPAWNREGQPQAGPEFGFAPLSVTQSGVAYSAAAPASAPAESDQPKIADLPAWASSYFSTAPDRPATKPEGFGVLGFGALPEPAAWVLILIGTAMICGALRGLIVANRRLARLREDDEA